MAKILARFAVLLAVVFIIQLDTRVLGDERYYREYTQAVKDVSALVDWNETLPTLPGYDCYVKRPLNIPPIGEVLEFPCEIQQPSDEIPTSAHKVRPADIKVIGAMGDSLTAGNGAGACFVPELAYMYRGLIYSHGGDETFERNPTLANILRKFNPELKGYGVETGNWDSDEAGMNVGFPGDISRDMPHQADQLVQKMKAQADIDYENDWKVITLFIGGNDLCASCNNVERYTAENYVAFIREALWTLHDEMPRTIVNVVGVLQVYQVDLMRAPICNFFHMLFCSCGMFLTPDELDNFEALTKEYQILLEEDIMSGQYDDKEDFTVVLQPFLHNTSVPFLENGEPDYSYFAPDCFHFSAKGHAQSGIELWNNMIEPVGEKRVTWVPGQTTISCPAEDFPYVYTNLNSNPEFWATEPTTTGKATEPTTTGKATEPTTTGKATSMMTSASAICQVVLVNLSLFLAALQY